MKFYSIMHEILCNFPILKLYFLSRLDKGSTSDANFKEAPKNLIVNINSILMHYLKKKIPWATKYQNLNTDQVSKSAMSSYTGAWGKWKINNTDSRLNVFVSTHCQMILP